MQASKVNWRPIHEYWQINVNPGYVAIFVDRDCDVVEAVGKPDGCLDGITNYAVIEKPVVERRLKPCPHCRHGLSSGLKIKEEGGCSQVWCLNCGAKGPIAHEEHEAKEAWGYA